MLKIIFKDPIGEWLVPARSTDSFMYQITGEKELTQHYMKDLKMKARRKEMGYGY